jgi:hypothetical protein
VLGVRKKKDSAATFGCDEAKIAKKIIVARKNVYLIIERARENAPMGKIQDSVFLWHNQKRK